MWHHRCSLNWFLFLALALTLLRNLTYKYPQSPPLPKPSIPTRTQVAMASSSLDSNPGCYFNPDLVNDGVDKCQLSLVAHHLSIKQFNETDIKRGLIGYLGDAAVFKLWNPYVESTLDLFSWEAVVVQAHDLRPVWRTSGIAKWIRDQIVMPRNE